MEVLTFNFFLLSIIGVWKPRGWRGIKAVLYKINRSIVVIVNHIFLLSGILDLEFKNVDLDAFVDNLALIFAMVVVRQKIVCVIQNRTGVVHILDSLVKSPFKLRDQQEELIFSRFNDFAR